MSKLLINADEAEAELRDAYGLTDAEIERWRERVLTPPTFLDDDSDETRNSPEMEYRQNRQAALAKNDGKCVYCGAPADSVDHVVPRSRGGSHHIDNLVPCCIDCNRRKKDRLDWRPS